MTGTLARIALQSIAPEASTIRARPLPIFAPQAAQADGPLDTISEIVTRAPAAPNVAPDAPATPMIEPARPVVHANGLERTLTRPADPIAAPVHGVPPKPRQNAPREELVAEQRNVATAVQSPPGPLVGARMRGDRLSAVDHAGLVPAKLEPAPLLMPEAVPYRPGADRFDRPIVLPPSDPAVEISIGRIEVRTDAAERDSPPRQPAATSTSSFMSLDDYLHKGRAP
jgi:hypothetical protein